ncbi:putative PAS domain protein [Emiliania huxleyi CCMP1516]|uniref:PAS domain-containing protein n=2 Tax=Emiliania huxleyi TaxID=2903 RepID=A0A0D3KGD3_EMIH1|nr:putative PAS domain protein [Emiliania huxleyi CCMP1516]EOD34818.1 putative PAS domain protein [Emiliania huxleyi CCMP1516]|eukprot:XP_005787247.1 putative PAS domain protein [Emiliania huxleyi CCMP1516]
MAKQHLIEEGTIRPGSEREAEGVALHVRYKNVGIADGLIAAKIAQRTRQLMGVRTLSEALQLSDECRVITTGSAPFNIVHTNKAWSKLTGFKFTEVANRSNSFLQGPHTEAKLVERMRAASEKGETTRVRVVNYDRYGTPFYNSIEIFPLRDMAGKLTHYCGVLHGEDIPDGVVPPIDRKPEELFGSTSGSSTDPDEEEETAAAASGWPAAAAGRGAGRVKRLRRGGHVTLQEALDNTEDAVVMTQPHPPYAITHVNAPWCEMCGYTLEEVEGLSSSILQGAETDEARPRGGALGKGVGAARALLSELMASVRRGESSSATLVNYKKGGARFLNQAHAPVYSHAHDPSGTWSPPQVHIQPVFNQNDEVDQFMAMLHEVDEKERPPHAAPAAAKKAGRRGERA